MTEILLAEAAYQDYTEALRWYAERSRRAAVAFEAEVAQALETVAAAPERYPLCDELHRFYLLKRYPYQLIYRAAGPERWLVVAVAHTSRAPGYWLDR